MPSLEILVVLALVLVKGYFAMSELAVVSARRALGIAGVLRVRWTAGG